MYCHIHHCHYHHCNCVPKDNKENGKALTQEELVAYTQEMKEELKDYTVDLKDQIFSYIDIGLNPVEIANTFASLKGQDTYILSTLTNKIDELNNTTNLSMFNLRTRVTDLEGQSATIIQDLATSNVELNKVKLDTGITATAKFGGVARSQANKNADIVTAKDFGILPSNTLDQTDAFNLFCTHLRETRKKGFIDKGTYVVRTGEVDISGCFIEGAKGDWENRNGTIIKGLDDRVGALLTQKDNSYHNVVLRNIGFTDAHQAVALDYVLFSKLENLYVQNCVNGISVGKKTTDAGALWNAIKQCRVKVTGWALKLEGKAWNNANHIESCYFFGDEYSVIGTESGYGALANTFTNTEFAGGRGLHIKRTKSTMFNNCFFEATGTNIKLSGDNKDVAFNNGVWGSLRKDPLLDRGAFIYHEDGTLETLVINGGYITIDKTDGTQENLNFISSSATKNLTVNFQQVPYINTVEPSFALLTDSVALASHVKGLGKEIFKPQFFEEYGSFTTPASAVDIRKVRDNDSIRIEGAIKVDAVTIVNNGAIYLRLNAKDAPLHGSAAGTCIYRKKTGGIMQEILGMCRVSETNISIYLPDATGKMTILNTTDIADTQADSLLLFNVEYFV